MKRYNPYKLKIDVLAQESQQVRLQYKTLSEQLLWQEKNSPKSIQQQINGIKKSLSHIWFEIALQKACITDCNAALASYRRSLSPNSDDLTGDARKAYVLRRRYEKKKTEFNEHSIELKDLRDQQSQLQMKMDELKAALDGGASQFDKSATLEKLDMMKQTVERIERDKQELEMKEKAFNQQFDPLYRDLCAKHDDLHEKEAILARAEEYNKRLEQAATGYDRKLIHEECMAELGDGAPAKIIRQVSSKIARMRYDIKKTAEHVGYEVSKMTKAMQYRNIIIDGNNLCHYRNKFDGTALLVELAQQLSHNYELTVVFDHSILKHVKLSVEKLYKLFEDKQVSIHVVQPQTKADLVILNLANKSDTAIISNDCFVEYSSKTAVKDGRVIKYELISQSRIMIDALNLDLSLASQEANTPTARI